LAPLLWIFLFYHFHSKKYYADVFNRGFFLEAAKQAEKGHKSNSILMKKPSLLLISEGFVSTIQNMFH